MQQDRRKYDGLSDAEKIDRILEKLEEILQAFPYGIEHHKTEHIEREDDKKASKELIKSLKSTAIKSAVNAFLILLGALLLTGLVTKFKEFLGSIH
jgi:predicted RNA-binding protein with EMAP domain